MKNLKWVGLLAAGLLVLSCFQDWVIVKSINLHISGVQTEGTTFGKPAAMHFLLTAFFVVFTLVPRVWAKRFNLLAGSINLAWALRNYFEVGACSGGECPEKQVGIYLMLGASIVMLISTFFPDMPGEKKP